MRKRVVLGAAVKAIREARGKSDPIALTAAGLGDPLSFRGSRFAVTCLMSHAHLCNIEAGRKQPPEDVIHRIAAHLGVPVDAISYFIDVPMEAAA